MPRGSRTTVAFAALACAMLTLTGCAAPTTPPTTPASPSPTAFTSEAEAFAAAEATYRAYVDALNEVDLADPSTFEPVFALTTGDARAGEMRSLREMHDARWSVTGNSRLLEFFPMKGENGTLSAIACYDVSQIVVSNADGQPQLAEGRAPVIALALEFQGDPVELLISRSDAVEDARCAP